MDKALSEKLLSEKSGVDARAGDIVIARENFRFFFPLTSCIVVSVLLTILFWLFRK